MNRLHACTLGLAVALVFSSGASASDDGLEFSAKLRGSEEVPPVETDTRGRASFEVDADLMEISYELTIKKASNILGTAGAHIHCGRRGENGPVVAFLAGQHPGGLQGTVKIKATLTDQNIVDPSCGATIAELVDAMAAGDTYVNSHSDDHPTGEVRGQIEPEDDD